MMDSDYRKQFEDVTVKPGDVVDAGDTAIDLGLVSHHAKNTTAPTALGLKCRWLASRYALVLVWAMMAGYFLIVRTDTFGRLAAFESIFGSQSTLVFLGVAALITLSVGEFDLSIASIAGLSATTVPVLVSLHHWNVAWAYVPALLVVPRVRRYQRVLRGQSRRRFDGRDPGEPAPSSSASPSGSRHRARCRSTIPPSLAFRCTPFSLVANFLLLRTRPRAGARVRAIVDTARAPHALRRCEPRRGATRGHPGQPRARGFVPGGVAHRRNGRDLVGVFDRRFRRQRFVGQTSYPRSRPCSSGPPSFSRATLTPSGCSSASTSWRPASSGSNYSATAAGYRTRSTARVSSRLSPSPRWCEFERPGVDENDGNGVVDRNRS